MSATIITIASAAAAAAVYGLHRLAGHQAEGDQAEGDQPDHDTGDEPDDDTPPKRTRPPGTETGSGQIIITIPQIPPPAEDSPDPGEAPGDPASTPIPGTWYQVQSGDTGSRIVRLAYQVPAGGGARVRAWQYGACVIRSARNRRLSPSGADTWDGALVPSHDGYAPRGSGSRFPVVWIPPTSEVDW